MLIIYTREISTANCTSFGAENGKKRGKNGLRFRSLVDADFLSEWTGRSASLVAALRVPEAYETVDPTQNQADTRRLACSRIDTCTRLSAAGVTPEMRLACPIVTGRIRSSFSRISRESPLMAL